MCLSQILLSLRGYFRTMRQIARRKVSTPEILAGPA